MLLSAHYGSSGQYDYHEGLTNVDVGMLNVLVSSSNGALVCETEREVDGKIWAVIRPRCAKGDCCQGYLVYRRREKLILLDLGLTGCSIRTVGAFAYADDLVAALDERFCWQF